MEKLQYKLEGFEGPLDLLLSLISKNKLDIYDIPISELLEQYTQQIDFMRDDNMEIASEFLEMAARLVRIKSVSLLPKQDEGEELKLELTGQLLEYRQCKRIAEVLCEMYSADSLVRGPADIPVDYTYSRQHEQRELVSALFAAMGRGKSHLPPKPESFAALVSRKIVSVASQAVFVLRRLWSRKPVSFRSLFSGKSDRSERVAAFLAVLELVKNHRIRVEGDGESCKVKLVDGGEKS